MSNGGNWYAPPLINGWSVGIDEVNEYLDRLRDQVVQAPVYLDLDIVRHGNVKDHYIEESDMCADCLSKHVQYTKIDENMVITHHCEDCWVIVHGEKRDEE